LDIQKKRKNVKKRKRNNMYCRPKILGINTTLNQIYCPLRKYYAIYIINIHFLQLYWRFHVVKSQQSLKRRILDYVFTVFFEMPLQKT